MKESNSEYLKNGISVIKQLLDKSKLGYVLIDKNFRAIEANDQFANMLGYTKEEVLQLHSWDWDATVTKEDIQNTYDTSITEPINLTLDTFHRRKDGTLINVFFTSDVAVIDGENVAFCLCKDNTEQYKIENALKKSEAKLKNFVENAHDLMFTVNEEYIVTYFSPNVKNIYNMDNTYSVGKNFLEIIQKEDKNNVKKAFDQLLKGTKDHVVTQYRVIDTEKILHWFSGSFTLAKDENKKPMIIGIARDIEDQKRYEEKLKFLSFHDPLTGLYNRAYFEDVIHRLENSRLFPITIFSIDIDHLKYINDTYGHHAGDKVIKACAQLLKNIFRKEDILARIGGDEFVAILPNTDEETAKMIAKRIVSNLKNQLANSEIETLELSFGFSTGTNSSLPLIEIYKYADNKLIKIKEAKRKHG